MAAIDNRDNVPKSKLLVPDSYLTGNTRKRQEFGQDSKNINDEEYWWNFVPPAQAEAPSFEKLDEELVLNQLRYRIERRELPVIEIPSNVMRTLKILDDPDFSYTEVAELIERSPAMAGEFIKITNSSIYGNGSAVRDLKSALPRLGKTKLKSLLFIYSSRMNFLGNKLFNNLAVDIVEHSYAVGLVAAYLSQRFFADPDTAFLSGLLHDIGKLAIIKGIIDTHTIPSDLGFAITEDTFSSIFPQLHEKAGQLVAENWKLDEDVKMAILHHHDLKLTGTKSLDPETTINLCHLIHISDTIARMLGKGRPIKTPVNLFKMQSAAILGLDKTWDNVSFLKEIPNIVNFKLDR